MVFRTNSFVHLQENNTYADSLAVDVMIDLIMWWCNCKEKI